MSGDWWASMRVPQSFVCPNCSASLDDPADRPIVRCAYCGSSVAVPETLRPATPARDPRVPDPSLIEVAALLRAGKRVQATIQCST